mgnify:CR=1 FL=1
METETISTSHTDLYQWKERFFSSRTDIFKAKEKVGFLKQYCFSRKIPASIFDERYVFRSKGFFQKNIEIWKVSNKQKVGEIRFHSWSPKSDIMLSDGKKRYHWKFSNIWDTRWEVTHQNQRILYSKTRFSKGKMRARGTNEQHGLDPILLLSAMYVYSYFRQQLYVIAIFIPIILAATG